MEVSNKLLAVLVVVAMVVSIGGTMTMVSVFPGRPPVITGRAGTQTAQGIALVDLQSEASIRLIVQIVDFDTIAHGEYNDTTDYSPHPFVLENNGTDKINVSMWQENGALLWSDYGTQACPECFQYNVTKNDSCTYVAATDWSDIVNESGGWTPTDGNLVQNLSQGTGTKTIDIQLNISVPSDEPAGSKSATMRFYAVLG